MKRELMLMSPWRGLSAFRRDMDELMNRFFGDWEREGTPWFSFGEYPRMESYVEGNTLMVKADLPGVEPHEVEITVEGNRLTIKGERKASREQKHEDYLHREVSHGTFARTMALPEGVKAEEVQASYHNGVLEVSIPLPAAVAPKKVPVEVQGEEHKRF